MEQPLSPGGSPLVAPLAGSSPLHSVDTRAISAGAARSFVKRSASYTSNTAHLAAIPTENTLSLLRKLGVYTKASLPDIAHQIYKQELAEEYVYATTNISRRSEREKAEIVPNTF